MAGEWLKFDASTPEKPEVLAITVAMGWDDPDLTVGKLLRVWRWFDQQTLEGNAPSVTAALLDRLIGVTGLCAAMQAVGWLIADADGVRLPNFDRHNGKTAKDRALTAKRVAAHKTKEKSNDEGNAPSVTSPLPREEKRREETTEANASVEAAKPRATKKCPASFEPESPEAWIAEHCPGLDWVRETESFRDYTFKNAKTDWHGTWRNWMRKAYDDDATARLGQPSFRERDAANAAARVSEFTGGRAVAKPVTRQNDVLQEVFDATPRLVG